MKIYYNVLYYSLAAGYLKNEIPSVKGRGRYCLEYIYISLSEMLMCASIIVLI